MNYFLRNNETDFNRWYRHLVPYALVLLKAYEKDSLKLVFHNDEYHDLLLVKKQLTDIRASLDEEHLSFFENSILKKKLPAWGDKKGWSLYKDVYHSWQNVCFPDGKRMVKELDPVILGGELKRLRIIRGINVKQAAEIIGISPKALYAYEEGTREMKASVLYKLCQVYKTDLDCVIESIA